MHPSAMTPIPPRRAWLHDDMNVLCLGSRVIGPELASSLVMAFLGAEYVGDQVGGERLARRVAKIHKLEDSGTLEDE